MMIAPYVRAIFHDELLAVPAGTQQRGRLASQPAASPWLLRLLLWLSGVKHTCVALVREEGKMFRASCATIPLVAEQALGWMMICLTLQCAYGVLCPKRDASLHTRCHTFCM